jgi:hypothetical protein
LASVTGQARQDRAPCDPPEGGRDRRAAPCSMPAVTREELIAGPRWPDPCWRDRCWPDHFWPDHCWPDHCWPDHCWRWVVSRQCCACPRWSVLARGNGIRANGPCSSIGVSIVPERYLDWVVDYAKPLCRRRRITAGGARAADSALSTVGFRRDRYSASRPHEVRDGVTEGTRTPDLQGHNLAL